MNRSDKYLAATFLSAAMLFTSAASGAPLIPDVGMSGNEL
jgi:hypothetical protein